MYRHIILYTFLKKLIYYLQNTSIKTGSNTGSTYSKCGRPKNIWSINMRIAELQGMQAILLLRQTC